MIDEKILIDEIEHFTMQIGSVKSEEIKLYEKEYKKSILKMIDEQPKVNEWISVTEKLPEEHDSIFAQLIGTDKFNKAMWKSCSDDVNVTIEFEDGTRKTVTSHTNDGVWKIEKESHINKCKVVAWQPLPTPYEEEE